MDHPIWFNQSAAVRVPVPRRPKNTSTPQAGCCLQGKSMKNLDSNLNHVTVLLADDAAVIRRTVKRFLESEPAIKVLGEAVNFRETMSMAGALKPDVILLDLHMPDDHVYKPELVKSQLSRCGCRVLAMSLSGDYEKDEESRGLAKSFGAVALLDKSRFYDELIPAILSQR
jgi:DNA-binding NarL/FixJ family response regulator